jgi:hypothetical protein
MYDGRPDCPGSEPDLRSRSGLNGTSPDTMVIAEASLAVSHVLRVSCVLTGRCLLGWTLEYGEQLLHQCIHPGGFSHSPAERLLILCWPEGLFFDPTFRSIFQ